MDAIDCEILLIEVTFYMKHAWKLVVNLLIKKTNNIIVTGG